MPFKKIGDETYSMHGIVADPDNPLPVASGTVPGLAIPEHDYIGMTYTGSDLTGVEYRQGGSGGTVVATLVLTYDGSGNLLTVTRS